MSKKDLNFEGLTTIRSDTRKAGKLRDLSGSILIKHIFNIDYDVILPLSKEGLSDAIGEYDANDIESTIEGLERLKQEERTGGFVAAAYNAISLLNKVLKYRDETPESKLNKQDTQNEVSIKGGKIYKL